MSAIMKKKVILSSVLAVICGACLSFAGAAFAARASAASAAPEYAYEYPQVGELTLPSVLSDGMVLQQKENVHVWGLTVGGREVTASLALASAPDTVIAQGSSIAGENGRFDIEFDGRDASFDEYVVTVGDGSTTIHIEDVLFGEVWLTGGQSNMELQLQYVIDGPELIRAARGNDRYANLRLFLEPTMPEGKDLNSQFEYLPQFDIKGARWGRANVKDDVKIVSAVSYACARKMFEELNAAAQVPVAIINTAVGATSIEAWMSRTSIDNTPEVVNWIKNIKKNYVSWENWTDSRPEDFDYAARPAQGDDGHVQREDRADSGIQRKGAFMVSGGKQYGRSGVRRFLFQSPSRDGERLERELVERRKAVLLRVFPYQSKGGQLHR